MQGIRNTALMFPRLASRTAAFNESVIREMTRLGDESGAVNLTNTGQLC
jgi:hypothetical protein